MSVIAFVPIKLRSKRLPGKNLLPLMGKPMCYHIFEALLQAKAIDRTYVYCSDESIMQYIPPQVEFLKRPQRLDRDKVKGLEIYREFVKAVAAHIYVLAHATSPFLRTGTIDRAAGKVVSGNYDSAFSAQKIQTFVWYNNNPLNYRLDDVPRTQDIEPILVETSGFYIFKKEIIEAGRRIGSRPWLEIVDNIEALDIDSKEDYEIALRIGGQ